MQRSFMSSAIEPKGLAQAEIRQVSTRYRCPWHHPGAKEIAELETFLRQLRYNS